MALVMRLTVFPQHSQAGVKTLVLTHFNAMAPEMLAAIEQDVRRDFSGQLSMGRDLLALDL